MKERAAMSEQISSLYNSAATKLSEIQELEKQIAEGEKAADQANAIGEQSHNAAKKVKIQVLTEDKKTLSHYLVIAENRGGECYVSPNVFTKPDMPKLEKWYQLIGTEQTNFARQLYKEAKEGIQYLNSEIHRLELSSYKPVEFNKDRFQKKLETMCQSLLKGNELSILARNIRVQGKAYAVDSKTVYAFEIPKEQKPYLRFGYIHRPFRLNHRYEGKLVDKFGTYYDRNNDTIKCPFGVASSSSTKIVVKYDDEHRDVVVRGIQGMMFNVIRHYPPVGKRILYLDMQIQNADISLGAVKGFCGNSLAICYPMGEKNIETALSELLEEQKKINSEHRFLFVCGYPQRYNKNALELLRILSENYKHYNLTIVLLHEKNSDGRDNTDGLKSILYDALTIESATDSNVFEMRFPRGGKKYDFEWFDAPGEVNNLTIETYNKRCLPNLAKFKDYCPCPSKVGYSRGKGRKVIELPFGIDEQGHVASLSMNTQNFAVYLAGTSGSGKSSLIQMFISSILYHYHPDDVELYLADFKATEFNQYIDHRPPHVKCVLMDKDPVYSYSFLDMLHQEYLRRNVVFAKHGWKDISELPSNVYMPIVFVIIDEYDVMANAIKEKDEYRRKLADLLSKSRQRGFRFIFSSQRFISVANTMEGNINVRIAMHQEEAEIYNVLNITPRLLTPKQRAWCESAPMFQSMMTSFHLSGIKVSIIKNLFYDSKAGTDDYEALMKWIALLNKSLAPDKNKALASPETYVPKTVRVRSGLTKRAFEQEKEKMVLRIKKNRESLFYQNGNLWMFIGVPKSFRNIEAITLTAREKQNIVLAANLKSGDSSYSSVGAYNRVAKVVAAAIKSVQLNDIQSEIWLPQRGLIDWERVYGGTTWDGIKIVSGPREIEERIAILTNRLNALGENELMNHFVVICEAPQILSELEAYVKKSPVVKPLTAVEMIALSKKGYTRKEIEEQCEAQINIAAVRNGLANTFINLWEDAPASGCHFMVLTDSVSKLSKMSDIKSKLVDNNFEHLLTFKMPASDLLNSDLANDQYKRIQSLGEDELLYTNGSSVMVYVPYE